MESQATSPTTLSEGKKPSAVVKWALILGIAIVINLFITYAVRLLSPEPLYTDFCEERQVMQVIETPEACVAVGGQWNANVPTEVMRPDGGPLVKGYCDPDFSCRKQHEEALKVYNRNVFIVFVVAGLLLLAGSVFLKGSDPVAMGLSFGGVLALIIGSIRYWSDMQDSLRVIILGIALASLIWLAWKKFSDEKR